MKDFEREFYFRLILLPSPFIKQSLAQKCAWTHKSEIKESDNRHHFTSFFLERIHSVRNITPGPGLINLNSTKGIQQGTDTGKNTTEAIPKMSFQCYVHADNTREYIMTSDAQRVNSYDAFLVLFSLSLVYILVRLLLWFICIRTNWSVITRHRYLQQSNAIIVNY